MHNLQSKKCKCHFCKCLHYVYDYDFVYVFVFEYVYEYEFVFEYVYVFDLKRGAQKRARRTSRPFPSGQKKTIFFLFFRLTNFASGYINKTYPPTTKSLYCQHY